ncbi:UNVERIFIED_CONTAM: hypothetical protein Scaly_1778500 [Sesamum calycinum]|uniref:Reverse transcriptase RNase H-like domain-containing protein n=1 Tax=Sesamum calycinum TaxID=2727403 RepID=A0AAW2NUU2_9LAMI
MLHKNVECCVDDLIVESEKREDHLHNLRKRGTEIEQAKIDAILRMPEPRNIHELKSLQSKLAYLQRRRLILYVAAQELSVGILLAQVNDEGKENALYYSSRTMTPNELKYSPIEKLCLALIFSIQKLKHYFQSHSIHLVSKANPLKYVMEKPVLSDRLARWLLGSLGDVELKHLSRKDNKQANALAKLASTLSMTDKETSIPIYKSWVIPPIFSDDKDDTFQEEENHAMDAFEVEEEDWRQPLVDYLKY